MAKPLTIRKINKLNLHTRYSGRYGIPMDILKDMLTQLQWQGYGRFRIAAKRLSLMGIKINERQVRYIYFVFKNTEELRNKLKRGGEMNETLRRIIYEKS